MEASKDCNPERKLSPPEEIPEEGSAPAHTVPRAEPAGLPVN
jgi:hypothetical protein